MTEPNGNTVVAYCQRHGIHDEMFSIPIGEQNHVFCAVCLVERLDGLGVERMMRGELTPAQMAELKRQAEEAKAAMSEAAE